MSFSREEKYVREKNQFPGLMWEENARGSNGFELNSELIDNRSKAQAFYDSIIANEDEENLGAYSIVESRKKENAGKYRISVDLQKLSLDRLELNIPTSAGPTTPQGSPEPVWHSRVWLSPLPQSLSPRSADVPSSSPFNFAGDSAEAIAANRALHLFLSEGGLFSRSGRLLDNFEDDSLNEDSVSTPTPKRKEHKS